MAYYEIESIGFCDDCWFPADRRAISAFIPAGITLVDRVLPEMNAFPEETLAIEVAEAMAASRGIPHRVVRVEREVVWSSRILDGSEEEVVAGEADAVRGRELDVGPEPGLVSRVADGA